MNKNQETPEHRRERLRQELKRNPASSINGGGLPDLVGSLGWKGTGMLILVMILGVIIYSVFVR